mmetsp:Transcript_3169/g.5891  ORF Transcript_3169/g.5891 Transcript_3169/m.5891 type:complete len:708 (+) Transcript_3169:276-2399(+)
MDNREKKVLKRHHVCFKHNSLVDFSFMDEKQSANALTLAKLNSLFGKVADRNDMGIRADKLFRFIRKMDINKLKIEWYGLKLGIVADKDDDVDDGSCSGSSALKDCSGSRIISRGPFIATFKHESITFVSMLENAARPLINRRRKRMNKKGTSVSSGIHTNRCTVKSAPAKSNNNEYQKVGNEDYTYDADANSVSSKLSKRLKRGDKTGMIIVTKVEDDAISTVSTSPTSDGSTAVLPSPNSATSVTTKPFSVGKNGTMSSPSTSKVAARTSHSSRKSTRKSRRDRKRESLRPVKSIGESSRGYEGDQDEFTCAASFPEKAKHIQTQNIPTSADREGKGHDRSPSNTDAVDIREVLHEYKFPEDGGHRNIFVPKHFQPSERINQGSFFHPIEQHSHIMATSQARFPSQCKFYGVPQNDPHMMYSYHPDTFPQVYWDGVTNPINAQYPYMTQNDNTEHEECLLLKNIASFIKKLFGVEERRGLYVNGALRHKHLLHGTPNPWNPHCELKDFQAPNRPRARSRVFSGGDTERTLESLNACGHSTHSEPDMQAIHVCKAEHDGRCSDTQEIIGKCEHNISTGLNEQACINWKAGGPEINKQHQSSIVDDFTLEPPRHSSKQGIDNVSRDIANKKVETANVRRILKERNCNKEKSDRPQSVSDSTRSKTEGAIGTRYSMIVSIRQGQVSGIKTYGNFTDSGDSIASYFHYR